MDFRIAIVFRILGLLKRVFSLKIANIILQGFFIVGIAFVCQAQQQDIGLKLRDDNEDVPIAVKPEASSTSPLKVHKNGVNYGIELVDVNHPMATKARVKLPSGEIKALKKFGCEALYPNFGVVANGIYSFTVWGERAIVNCMINSPNSATCNEWWPVTWVIRPSSREGSLRADQITADKVCQYQGFPRAVNYQIHDYSSPGNNEIAYWNGSGWIVQNARTSGNQYLLYLQCSCE
jgi:hypothetical protein